MGIVVVAAAGNLGPKDGSITIPGVNKNIITVGCYDHVRSGRGSIEKNIWKPDLVAPGTGIYSCNAFWNGDVTKKYIAKSGTSMSTPIVTGAVAGLLSGYPNLTNWDVKEKLRSSCQNLRMPQIRQGSGLLNVAKLYN